MAIPHNISCQVWIVVIARGCGKMFVNKWVLCPLSFCTMAVLDSLDQKSQLFWIFEYVFQLLLFTRCFGWIMLFCYASLDFIHWSPRSS